jgi:hypothetical protein
MLWSTPFEPVHLAGLSVPPSTEVHTQALTIWDGDSTPLCCFGITSPWPGLGVAWCAERDPAQMRHLGRLVGLTMARTWRQWLAEVPYQRLESRAPQTHAAAQRLLRWLGFTQVSVKPHYGPDDITVVEYVLYPKG